MEEVINKKELNNFEVSILENGYLLSVSYRKTITGEYSSRRLYIQSLDELQSNLY